MSDAVMHKYVTKTDGTAENACKHFLDENNRLVCFPAKRKKKLYALRYLSTKFETGKTYTEKQFNEILEQWHTFHDPATLRRELYNNRFIDREASGSSYWLEPVQPVLE